MAGQAFSTSGFGIIANIALGYPALSVERNQGGKWLKS
jgi:hypothetical protein